MLVAAEYDLLGPSIFLCEGKQNRIRSLLLGRGYKEQDFNDELKYRLMGLTLIHRYSNLKAQVIVSGWKTRARNLLELQNLIWNFE